jgi:vacuolar-type H+-ATPase subunit C/Vma6
VASALQRYAYGQARVRARLARLLTRQQLDTLATQPDVASLERELAAAGLGQPALAVLAAIDDLAAMLDGPPREVVRAYRGRFECENLKLLLRARERSIAWAEVEPLLLPVGRLGPGRPAQDLLEAASLADAVARLEATPFGDALRRQIRAAGAQSREPERFGLELIAEREAYESIWRAVSGLDAGDRRAAIGVVGVELDAANLVRTLRMRQAHGLAPEEVLAYAIHGGLHLDARRRAALAHEPVESWASHLAGTPYAAALEATGATPALEHELHRIRARAAERALHGSPFHLGLMLAYLTLVELQAADLQRLLEGARLRRPDSWARAGLVGARGR